MTVWKKAAVIETILLVGLFFAYAGEVPPDVNEAHYLVKAKNFWQPEWCQNDLLAASGKAHATFYVLFGWPTMFLSLTATIWIARFVGWTMLAFGLQRLSWAVLPRSYLSLVVAVVWIAGIEYCDLAGEWVVGGIEAKVPAYGLVLFGLSQLVQRRWHLVWILFGAASAFHVLTGGWSVVAGMITWWFTERAEDDRRPLISLSLFLGGLIALCGLLPAIALSAGTSAEDATLAARIYSYYRIKHHLLPADFYMVWFLRHGALIIATALLARIYWQQASVRRIGWFIAGAVLIALAGLIVGLLPAVAPDLAAKLLRYYWFRLTDATVPLMAGLMVAQLIADNTPKYRWTGIAIFAVATILIAGSSYERSRLGIPPSASNRLVGLPPAPAADQQQAFADWLAVCRWARASTPTDEVFLTPRHQQTFKWYTGRAEVVNWKDVPQDTASLKEWHRRFQEVYPQRLGFVRVTIRYAKLREFRQRYGVRYMIVDRRMVGPKLPLIQLYPAGEEQNETYAVYELPRPE
jgi:hypothetical protein